MKFAYDDGGRKAAGYKGDAGDCACRSVAIVFGIAYQDAYERINALSAGERTGSRKRGVSNARTGVYRPLMQKLMLALGAKWTPCMGIGTGCKIHLRDGELPPGRHVVSCSKHFTAVIDGVIRDTSDPSRDGTRCVYGYWTAPASNETKGTR